MRLVSNNSGADLALRSVRSAMRQLAANLLRVMRGAGRGHEIPQQAQAIVEACVAYRDATGTAPSDFDLAQSVALDDNREWLEQFSAEDRALRHAESMIVRGALQVAASQMLGQRTQLSARISELVQGVHDRNEAIKAAHRAQQAKAPAQHRKLAKKSPKRLRRETKDAN